MSRIKNMTTGNPLSLILFFALPLILGSFGQQLYMIVDTIIVGRGVGIKALAALGATDWVYWMILWSVQALTQGFAILISQRFGADDRDGMCGAAAASVLLCAVIGTVLTIIGFFVSAPALRLLGTPDDIFGGALAYLQTMCLGTLIVTAYNMVSSILRSFGDGKTPLAAMAVSACVNIALDLLFVMVFGWGIVGAAVATLIAQLVSFLYCMEALRRMRVLVFKPAHWRPNFRLVWKLCMLGLPLVFQSLLIAVGGMILQSVINSFGSIFVAGFTATNKIYGVLEVAAISFGFATTTFMAQNYGAGLFDRIREGIRTASRLSVCVSLVISAVMIVSGKYLLSLFVPHSDPESAVVLDTAYRYLVTMSSFLFVLYLLHAYRSALQGLGNTLSPMLSGCVEFAARVGIALGIPRFLGPRGLFLAEPGAWLGAAVFLIFSYYRHVRRLSK